jgi:hypothetical protein
MEANMKKHKTKIITIIVVLVVLAGAWLYGDARNVGSGETDAAITSGEIAVVSGSESESQQDVDGRDISDTARTTDVAAETDATDATDTTDTNGTVNEMQGDANGTVNDGQGDANETMNDGQGDANETENNGQDGTSENLHTGQDDASNLPQDQSSEQQSGQQSGQQSVQQNGQQSGQQSEQQNGQQSEQQSGQQSEQQNGQQNVNDDGSFTVTLSVNVNTIINNMQLLNSEKHELIPTDGLIFAPQQVTAYEGESVFNVLQREMRRNGIHMVARFTPVFDSAYVEAINNIFEFDAGPLSGWMYSVNGEFPNFGSSRYILSQGDIIVWQYTLDLGRDIGGHAAYRGQRGE